MDCFRKNTKMKVTTIYNLLFGRQSQIIGRTCTVSKNINSSSIPSGSLLYEIYNFTFEGQINITETCPLNGSTIQEHRSFSSFAEIILSLICSISSLMINCNSITQFIKNWRNHSHAPQDEDNKKGNYWRNQINSEHFKLHSKSKYDHGCCIFPLGISSM